MNTPNGEPPPKASKYKIVKEFLVSKVKSFWATLIGFLTGKAREDWESQVIKRLSNQQLLNDCERDVAYAAWLHALSERRSKQLGVLAIPTAAAALIAALVALGPDGSSTTDGTTVQGTTPSPSAAPSTDESLGPGASLDPASVLFLFGLTAVVVVAAILALQLMLARDIEALRAAAAVHEHRASGCTGKPANAPDENEMAGDAKKDPGGGTTPAPRP